MLVGEAMNDLMEKFYAGEARDLCRSLLVDYINKAEAAAKALKLKAREQGFECKELDDLLYNVQQTAIEWRTAEMHGMCLR